MISQYIEKLIAGISLENSEMEFVMENIMDGKLTNSEIASFLTALRIKGETADEITLAAKVMRDKVVKIGEIDGFTIDTCGTGGDKKGTFNVSTAVAIVVAACGLTVVKHGNRSVSSKSGSADVLEELGIKIDMTPELVKECIKELNIGFLFAPVFHPAMKNVAPVRREMGIRTIFNLLGPLTNPAKPNGQVLGVYSESLTEVIVNVLKNLGTKRAMVVHGLDGLDEISISSDTKVTELKDGEIRSYTINPRDFGFDLVDIKEILGGDAKENAKIIMDILDGKKGAKRNMVLINAAAALYVGGKVNDINEGIEIAQEAIDSGRAKKKLLDWINFCERVRG